MERKIINPWKWQDQYSFVQANELSGFRRVVFCSGQTSTDADGSTRHAGDMAAQISFALDNLETVLAAAGMTLSNVVRMTTYTTDVERFLESYGVLAGRLEKADCRTAATLLGVTRLAFPDLLVEIEATAAD